MSRRIDFFRWLIYYSFMIKIKDMEFEYYDRDEEGNLTEMISAIRGIRFEAEKGAFIALCGRNGSGKSTFAKVLNRLLVPAEGTVMIAGIDALNAENALEIRKRVGMVFQNPEDQLVGSVVREDCAFGAENLGVPEKELAGRVDEALEAVGLSEKAEAPVESLSGGEKQKLAIAGVLAMGTECMVLDEATSMCDPASAREILQLLDKLHREKKLTIIFITHNMTEALCADMIYVFDKGRIAKSGRKQAIFTNTEKIDALGLEVPMAVSVARKLKEDGYLRTDELYSVGEICARLLKEHPYAFVKGVKLEAGKPKKLPVNPKSAILFDSVSFSYGKNKVLDSLSFSVAKGEYVVITGRTGAGKSTLLQLIPRLLSPQSGQIYVDGIDVNDRTTDIRSLRTKVGFMFQYPEQQLFAENVYEDVVFGVRNLGISEVEAEKRAYECIELVGLSQDVYDLPPDKLSGGERRRVALAGVLALQPEYLVMDEPFAGLDPEGRRSMEELILALNKDAGITVLLVSHDLDDALAHADRVICIENGCVVTEGDPAEVFCAQYRDGGVKAGVPFTTELMCTLRDRGMELSPPARTPEAAVCEIERCLRK